MAETDTLIRRLVDQSGRVGRLPPPRQPVLFWLGYSIPWVAFVWFGPLVHHWRHIVH